jgi:hypothetical protein
MESLRNTLEYFTFPEDELTTFLAWLEVFIYEPHTPDKLHTDQSPKRHFTWIEAGPLTEPIQTQFPSAKSLDTHSFLKRNGKMKKGTK